MIQSLLVLGRQPALGLAELESLYGADALRPAGNQAAVLDIPSEEIDFKRMGGSIKLCRVLTELPTTAWPDITDYLIKTAPEHLQYLPEGKLQLGLSAYGFSVSANQVMAAGLSLKKVIRTAGRSVRLIPNQEPALNSAQVLHNNLTGPLGWELVLVKDGTHTILAQTVREQDIAGYTARDQARPKRDARVGMLPPKLAQIIVNLAAGPLAFHFEHSILDPFCGTGVVLQEAALMGYSVYGTDIDPRMIDYASKNLEWLSHQHKIHPPSLQVGDATSFRWQPGFSVVATETYLGRPLNTEPSPEKLQEIINDCNTILTKFLTNIAGQTPRHVRFCLALPAWRIKNGFKHLKLLDSLEQLGYTRVSFVHTRNKDLIYHREGQIVARELVVLQRL